MARFNGWSEIILGVPAVVFGIFSLTSLVVGVGLLWLGWRELRLGDRLGRLDPDACRALAINQVVLLTGVLVYCGWQTYVGLTGPSLAERYPELAQAAPELRAGMDQMTRVVVVSVYATVAALSVIIQGVTAWYYLSRGRLVERLGMLGGELRREAGARRAA